MKIKKAPILLILVGPPGSGKSTYTQTLMAKENKWTRICRDDLRAMQYQQTKATDNVESTVSQIVEASITALLSKGKNVIADATHCKLSSINYYIKQFNHLAKIEFKVFDLPLQELHDRCITREKETGKHIPLEALEKMYNQFTLLKSSFNFEPIDRQSKQLVPLPHNPLLPTCVLCDLDGTVAAPNHRSMFNPTDAEIANDIPIKPTIKVIQQLDNQYQIIFVSGRNEALRQASVNWIERHIQLNAPIILHMRTNQDQRKDSIVKQEILHQHILPNYNVFAAFDDRLQVLRDCWTKENIFTFNVNQFLE
jgi:predicted kinase